MNFAALGWELTTVLGAAVAIAVSLALGFEAGVTAALLVLGAVTPLILISAGARLAAGIMQQVRRGR